MIRRLPEADIVRIAAGEVIERPVSVVKELVENALDAGARHITIHVEDGGLSRIEVTDDGCGIEPDDLPLALERHATSKIARFEDVEAVRTFGFRGEALASIAAAASLRITTRTTGGLATAAIDNATGRVVEARQGRAPGTTVEITSLFATTPARLKFLASPGSEGARITRLIQQLALIHPAVSFRLRNGTRELVGTPGTGDRREVLGMLYGPDAARLAREVTPLTLEGITVSGMVAAPASATLARAAVVVACNGRLIQHRALVHAVDEAYGGAIRAGQHPFGVVEIAVDPREIDVNVHPAKAEIRFRQDRAVYGVVQRAVRGAIVGAEAPTDPDAHPGAGEGAWRPSERPGTGAAEGAPVSGAIDLLLSPIPVQSRLIPAPSPGEHHSAAPVERGRNGEPPLILRAVGQMRQTYVLAEGMDGLYLVDQHAAHERILYERIQAQLALGQGDRQALLEPAVVDLEPDDLVAALEHREEFHAIGLELEEFGPITVLVRTVPATATSRDPAAMLRFMLAESARESGRAWVDRLAASLACHAAVRAGDTLELEEQRALLQGLEVCVDPRHCAHGRPTMLLLTDSTLERQFGRT